jgi:hypothetical protein
VSKQGRLLARFGHHWVTGGSSVRTTVTVISKEASVEAVESTTPACAANLTAKFRLQRLHLPAVMLPQGCGRRLDRFGCLSYGVLDVGPAVGEQLGDALPGADLAAPVPVDRKDFNADLAVGHQAPR